MTRVLVPVNLNNADDIIVDAPYTLSAPVIAAGIYIPDALAHTKTGSTRVQIYNSGAYTSQVYFRGGNYTDPLNPRKGYSIATDGSVMANIPAGQSRTFIMNKLQAPCGSINDILLIDFSSNLGVLSTINVNAEQLHINEYLTNPTETFTYI